MRRFASVAPELLRIDVDKAHGLVGDAAGQADHGGTEQGVVQVDFDKKRGLIGVGDQG